MKNLNKYLLTGVLVIGSSAAAMATAPDPATSITAATTSASSIVTTLIGLSITCAVAGIVFGYARKAKK